MGIPTLHHVNLNQIAVPIAYGEVRWATDGRAVFSLRARPVRHGTGLAILFTPLANRIGAATTGRERESEPSPSAIRRAADSSGAAR